MEPLPGGWSGQTFLATVGDQRTVVRIYAGTSDRGEQAAEVDAALLALVRGLVPVPEVLELRPADPRAGTPALLVTSFVEGSRGDELLARLADDRAAVLGRELGRLAGTLAGMATVRAGHFVDADLRIRELDAEQRDLSQFVQARPQLLADLGPDLVPRLLDVAEEAQSALDAVGRTTVVHSDLNPKNVLVDADSLAVTAVVDWEYAHSGSPYTDLGNLLRLDRRPGYEQAVLEGFVGARGGSATDAQELARRADLFALVELAGRPRDNPVAAAARSLLAEVARTGDPHAWPFEAGWTLEAPRA